MSKDNIFEDILGNPVDDYEGVDIDDFESFIVLTDEDGNEASFEFLDRIKYNGEEYVVLLPDDEESTEVVIFKAEGGDAPEEEEFVFIDDEETLNAVFEIFKEKFSTEFDDLD